MKKITKIGLAFAIAFFALFYVNYQSHKTITITFGMFAGSNWDVPNGDCYRIYENAIARFEKKYPNVKVKLISGIVKEDYVEWILEKSLQQDVPDVFMVPSESFGMFAQNGLLLNLESFMDEIDENKFYQSSLKAGQYKECQYALPFESVPTLMYVNKTLLEKENITLPSNTWTWSDFYSICQQVTKDTDGDGYLDQFGVYGYDWLLAAHSNGCDIMDENGNLHLNSSEMIESIDFMKKLTALNENMEVSSQDFDEGKVAFCPMEFSEYRAYKPYPWRVKKYSNFEWDALMLPSGTYGDNTSQINTLSMGISSFSSHKEIAMEFLKELTYSEECQNEIVTLSQGVPVLQSVTNSKETMDLLSADTPGDSNFQFVMLDEVMKQGTPMDLFTQYDEITSQLDAEIYRIVMNHSDDTLMELTNIQQKIQTK